MLLILLLSICCYILLFVWLYYYEKCSSLKEKVKDLYSENVYYREKLNKVLSDLYDIDD